MRQNGKQNFKCLLCGKQFVEAPSEHYPRISNEIRGWVDRLLLEKIPLAGIARVAQVSERWLQYYVNDKYDSTPRKLTVHSPKKTQLTLECDEMGSFVGIREISNGSGSPLTAIRVKSSVFISEREVEKAHKHFGTAYPLRIANMRFAITDFWAAYETVIPCKQHKAIGKKRV